MSLKFLVDQGVLEGRVHILFTYFQLIIKYLLDEQVAKWVNGAQSHFFVIVNRQQ